MRGPQPPPITVTGEERRELEALVRRQGTAQQIARRARIILAAADGANNAQIARQLGVNVEMVRLWRTRWLALARGAAGRVERGRAPGRRAPARRPVPHHRRAGLPNSPRWPARRPPRRAARSATGAGARSPTRRSRAASWRRSRRATRGGCSKGGSPAPPHPLLADARARPRSGGQGGGRLRAVSGGPTPGGRWRARHQHR